VSWRLVRELLNFIVVVVDPDCSVGVVVGVVDVVDDVGGAGDVSDVVNADEAGGAGISAVVMDAWFEVTERGRRRLPGSAGIEASRGWAPVTGERARGWLFR
jgi:hypothetical protein